MVASMVAVPTGPAGPGALPLANNFGHALIGIDELARSGRRPAESQTAEGGTYGAFATGIRRRARFRSAAA